MVQPEYCCPITNKNVLSCGCNNLPGWTHNGGGAGDQDGPTINGTAWLLDSYNIYIYMYRCIDLYMYHESGKLRNKQKYKWTYVPMDTCAILAQVCS